MENMKYEIKRIARNTRNGIQSKFSFVNNNEFKKFKERKKIFYMLVPTHGNLGDQAIAYASVMYLKNKLDEYEVIEINSEDTYKFTKAIENSINEDDIIVLHGGGNMGTHYITEEEKRRHIIKTFKNNKIISFTQTIYFSNDKRGKGELNKTINTYNSHNDLTILAREDRSYDTMKKYFTKCKIIKCPDIVFYLNNKLDISNNTRSSITTLLRKDKETYVDMSSKDKLINKLKDNYNNILVSDTLLNNSVTKSQRKSTLYKIWNDLYNSKVVITDRLHGMIFCAITKTPCIVTRSLDHKVVESYKWIKDLNYIKMVDNLEFDKISPIINELINLKYVDEFNFDDEYFNGLVKSMEL